MPDEKRRLHNGRLSLAKSMGKPPKLEIWFLETCFLTAGKLNAMQPSLSHQAASFVQRKRIQIAVGTGSLRKRRFL